MAKLILVSMVLWIGAPARAAAQDLVGNFSDFLLDRANDNYIYLFEVRLKNNAFFGAYFPNTVRAATAGDLRSLILNRSVWRESFELDMKTLVATRFEDRVALALQRLCKAVSVDPMSGGQKRLKLRNLGLFSQYFLYEAQPEDARWQAALEELDEICKKALPGEVEVASMGHAAREVAKSTERAAEAERNRVAEVAEHLGNLEAALAAASSALAVLEKTNTADAAVRATMSRGWASIRAATDAVGQAQAKARTGSLRDVLAPTGNAANSTRSAAAILGEVISALAAQGIKLPQQEESEARLALSKAADSSLAAMKAVGDAATRVIAAAPSVLQATDRLNDALKRLKTSAFLEAVNRRRGGGPVLTEKDVRLAAERPMRAFGSDEERARFVVATALNMVESFHAARDRCNEVRPARYTSCAIALADFVDAVAYGLGEFGADCGQEGPCTGQELEDTARFRRFAVFFAQLGDSNEKLSAALLKNVTVPSVSFGTKRQPKTRTVSVTAYFALGVGHAESGSVNSQSYLQPFVPVGVEYSHGSVQRRSHSLFFSVLDLGSPVLQKLNGTYTGSQLQNFAAPGVFYVWGYKESPLAWGLGVERVLGASTTQTWGNRFLIFWGLDLPLLLRP